MSQAPTWTRVRDYCPAGYPGCIAPFGGNLPSSWDRLFLMDGASTNAWISEDAGVTWQPTPVPWTTRGHSGMTTVVGMLDMFGGLLDDGEATDDYWYSGGFDRGEIDWRLMPKPVDPKRYPWPPPRMQHGFLSCNPSDSRQWLLGGLGEGGGLLNDVWSSWNTGCSWTRHTANAAWSPRKVAAFCGAARGNDPKTGASLSQLWVFGGSGASGVVTDTTYTSLDGETWIPVEGPWERRGQAYAAVLGDSIYVLGGAGYDESYPELWVADLVVGTDLPKQLAGDPLGWWYETPEWTLVDSNIPCGSVNFIATSLGGDLYISSQGAGLYRMSPQSTQPQ